MSKIKIVAVFLVCAAVSALLSWSLTSCGSSCADRGGHEVTVRVLVGTRTTMTQMCEGAR